LTRQDVIVFFFSLMTGAGGPPSPPEPSLNLWGCIFLFLQKSNFLSNYPAASLDFAEAL